MEERTKRIWLVVGIIVVLLACCIVAVVATAGGLMLVNRRVSIPAPWESVEGSSQARIERTFQVGDSSFVEVNNFAGHVSVTQGESGIVSVVATKRVAGRTRPANIRVSMTQSGDRVTVRTEKGAGLSSASVQIEITAPQATDLDVHTGAGEVTVLGIVGDIKAHSNAGAMTLDGVGGTVDASTNAGNVDVRGGSGPVRLQTNAGGVSYEGDPSGDCDMRTNAGSVRLVLPSDINVEIDLTTNTGSVSLDHALSETQAHSSKRIRGTIGDGSEGTITAHTNAGSVTVRKR